jgi:hypothetical protein
MKVCPRRMMMQLWWMGVWRYITASSQLGYLMKAKTKTGGRFNVQWIPTRNESPQRGLVGGQEAR